VGGRRSQRPGPSPTLVSLGPSHHLRHKSRVSLRGPPCALGVSGIPYGEVRDRNVVRIVYGSRDPKVAMEGRERTCLFHWKHSLEKHTQSYIKHELQDQHRHLCLQYRNASSMQEAETRYLAIKAWWVSSNCTSEDGLKHLQLWLAFWHFRYLQWGGFMELVCLLRDSILVFHGFVFLSLCLF
jgi:hypothetical protein